MIKTVLACCAVNIYALSVMYTHGAGRVLLIIAGVLYIIGLCIYPCRSKEGGRLGRIHRGSFLMKIFLVAVTAAVAANIFIAAGGIGWVTVTINSVAGFLMLALMFTVSAVRMYAGSVQLGIKWRVLGVVFAFMPIVNVLILLHMIKLTDSEYRVECGRLALDRSREKDRICATKYPILMVHGVFFRDTKAFSYWGRIPKALEQNGARIFYGSQQSADSVAGCAAELKARIDEIVEKEKCGKVNIIAL